MGAYSLKPIIEFQRQTCLVMNLRWLSPSHPQKRWQSYRLRRGPTEQIHLITMLDFHHVLVVKLYHWKWRNLNVCSILLLSVHGLVSFSIALGTYKSHSFLVIPYGWDNVPFPTKDRCATVEHFHLGLVGFQVFTKVISFGTRSSANVEFVGQQIFSQLNWSEKIIAKDVIIFFPLDHSEDCKQHSVQDCV